MTESTSRKQLDEAEVVRRIWAAKAKLGRDLVILGHHYMSDDVIQFADYRGDSLQLAQQAVSHKDVKYIVFCGVHFMAETASILSQPGQMVLMLTLKAGCQMADMAELEDVQTAWEALTGLWGDDVVPITYVNSTAALKAFCGEHGGITCTSSNAPQICRWALGRASHVLFFPDENLGANTALAMGIPPEKIAVWNPSKSMGGDARLEQATFVVWRGFCYVHHRFSVKDVETVREKYPGISVVVHPECLPEVVAQADDSGSTSYIIRYVQSAPAGARIAIGTEANLVYRLDKEHPDKLVVPLAESYCISMARNNMYDLLETLESILEGHPKEVVQVPPEIAAPARIAVERMLQES